MTTPRWTIAVISDWDDDPPDYLYENVATVEAETADEAVALYGETHPHHRDYYTVSARPEGDPW